TTAPRPDAADCAYDVRPAHSAHPTDTTARMLFANRAMLFALLFDCGDPGWRNIDPLLDAPAFSSLHVEVFVAAAVVSKVGKPTHAARHRRQLQAGVAEEIGALVDASGSVVLFVFVRAVEVLVVAVIIAGQLPDLDEVAGREPCSDLFVGHDVAGF